MNDNEHFLKPVSRRSLILGGITAGFALAVSPPTAFALNTDEDGLETSQVTIPTAGGSMPGYLAMPKKKGKYPVVIVVHEIFGVHAYIQDVCKRLAKLGYVVISPYLYFREGDVTTIKDIDKIISTVVSKVPQKQVMADLDATLEFLKKLPNTDVSKSYITGFCWGGNVTWMYASHNPKMRAGAAFYGKLEGPTSDQVKFPVDIAHDLKVPVIGFYGGKDKGISLESVEKMKKALLEAKSKSEIHVYPDAEHGFHADYRPSYNPAAAKDAWEKLVGWFKKH